MTPADRVLAAEARGRFAALVARPDVAVDLAHAALLVAAEERPGLDVEHYRGRLLELGLRARERLAERRDAPLDALNRFVFDELGFAGEQEHYYDPRNSLLSHVMDKRRGIPITLSVVYMEIGRRAGVEVEGVNMPGHFIVRARAAGQSALVDVFNRKVIDEAECGERLDELYGGQVPLTEAHLRAATTREILARILRNLKGVYAQAKLHRRALAAVERILLVAPQAHEEQRDRGLLLSRLGRHHEAVQALQTYLARLPRAPDAERVRAELRRVRSQLAALN